VIRMLADVQQKTIGPLIQKTITPGTVVYTDEYDIYARLSEWGYTHHTVCHRSVRVRDRGFEPRSPGWRPGVVPLDQSRGLQAEGEGVEPSRLIARPGSSRVPSPFGLPFPIVELRRQESNLRPPG
jgi:ISXO2 transposase-like protein